MKKFLAVVICLLPLTTYAKVVSFKCHSVDVEGINKFDASGVVSVDDLNDVEGSISMHVEKAQSAQSVQSFEDLRVTGFINHFEAGQVSPQEFDQLVLTTNEPYIKSIDLLMGYSNRLDSKVTSIDNFTYRSNCVLDY